jgi:hypothetical protein
MPCKLLGRALRAVQGEKVFWVGFEVNSPLERV